MLVAMPEGATRNGEAWPGEGETADLPTAEAAHLVASGVAEEVALDEPAAPPEVRRGRRKIEPESEG
ncbi:hypothetical protein ACWD1Z_23295 [Streptomyces sp. NPDC002784]